MASDFKWASHCSMDALDLVGLGGFGKYEVPVRIYKYPVVISIDHVYLVAEPPAQAFNLNRLILPSATGSGYLAKTIIGDVGDVKVSISNIDIVTVPCHIDNWEDLLPCEWDQVFSNATKKHNRTVEIGSVKVLYFQSSKKSGDSDEPLLKTIVKYFCPLMKARFLETDQRIRNYVLREHCQRQAVGQMIPNQMMRPPVQIPILQVLSRQRQFLREQYHQPQLP